MRSRAVAHSREWYDPGSQVWHSRGRGFDSLRVHSSLSTNLHHLSWNFSALGPFPSLLVGFFLFGARAIGGSRGELPGHLRLAPLCPARRSAVGNDARNVQGLSGGRGVEMADTLNRP